MSKNPSFLGILSLGIGTGLFVTGLWDFLFSKAIDRFTLVILGGILIIIGIIYGIKEKEQ